MSRADWVAVNSLFMALSITSSQKKAFHITHDTDAGIYKA